MPQLKIMGFDGVVPRTSPTLLSDSQAQQADNVKLYSRELRYWRGPAHEYTPLMDDVVTIYKYYNSTGYNWLTWDVPVDVAPSPTADEGDYRIYYTGDGVPKKTNEALAISGGGPYPDDWMNMGVPAPTAAPSVAVTGSGTTAPETRVYVYTYLSEFGDLVEESAPSPASAEVTVHTGQSVTVNGFTAPPTTNYNITGRRIYRSVTGETTNSYLFVAEIALATTSYSDSLSSEDLGEALPSLGWAPPPAELSGLLPLPNGSLAGFVDNTVWFSEPYYPHAWPIDYAMTVPYPIVGLGIYGASIVVMTERYPYIISGYSPGGMSAERVPLLEPCVSKASIVSNDTGVLYASPNGMIGIGPSMRGNVTQTLFRRDEWQAITPQFLAGATVDGRYFGVLPTSTEGKTLVISRDDIPALSYISVNAIALHVDSKEADLYFVSSLDGKIYHLDADELNPLPFEWKSKRFVLPQATTFSALKLDADFDVVADAAAYNAQVAAIVASNQALFGNPLLGEMNATPLNVYDVNGSILANIPPSASARSAQVLLYGDGELEASMTLYSFDPVRIPPFKSRSIEVKIVGTMNVRSVALATTVMELRE